MAAELDPSFKLRWCADADKANILTMIRTETEEYRPTITNSHKTKNQSLEPPPTKKSKLFLFMEAEEEYSSAMTSTTDELDIYLKDENYTKNENSLNFWRSNESVHPLLSEVARKILGIPATSAPIEHVFSHGGNILGPR